MEPLTALRGELVRYVRAKFAGRENIALLAEDIVHQAFLEVPREKQNFGYLSKACLHIAYKIFRRSDREPAQSLPEALWYLDSDDIVEEIAAADDTAAILASLSVLREIERIVITQRYYGDYSFAEIARQNHLPLGTVLAQHRRALEKLRPRLSQFAAGRQKPPRPPRAGKRDGFTKYTD